jgi:hybrid cluster-associated redox disulfide protein
MTRSLPRLDPGLTVAELLARWPQTSSVFVRRKMACPGCSMARFMSLAEAAAEYQIPPQDLLDDLAAAIADPAGAQP